MLPDMTSRLQAMFPAAPRVGQLLNSHAHNLYHKSRPHAAHRKKLIPASPAATETSGDVGADSYKYDAKLATTSVTSMDPKPVTRAIAVAFRFIASQSHGHCVRSGLARLSNSTSKSARCARFPSFPNSTSSTQSHRKKPERLISSK